jgi:flagellar basal body-associated protein FliL
MFKKNSLKQIVFLAIVVLVVVCVAYYFLGSNKSVSAFSGNDFQSFQVTANCADVTFKANDTVMYINIKYKYKCISIIII